MQRLQTPAEPAQAGLGLTMQKGYACLYTPHTSV